MSVLDEARIKGSILDPQNNYWLAKARVEVGKTKEDKSWARHKKNIDSGTATLRDVLRHIAEEIVELTEDDLYEGYEPCRKKQVVSEVADVINCAEIALAVYLMNEKRLSKNAKP